MFGLFRKKPAPSFEDQLQVLAQGGIALNASLQPQVLLNSWTREQFEANPYRLLLGAMGEEPEICSHIWHLDTECIECPGSYIGLARRMALLAQGSLPLTDIEDNVDLDESIAWLALTLDGARIEWEAKVDEDWIDATILSRFAGLLETRPTELRFTYVDLQAQDCLIGCSTPAQRQWLCDRTGLRFDWLR